MSGEEASSELISGKRGAWFAPVEKRPGRTPNGKSCPRTPADIPDTPFSRIARSAPEAAPPSPDTARNSRRTVQHKAAQCLGRSVRQPSAARTYNLSQVREKADVLSAINGHSHVLVRRMTF